MARSLNLSFDDFIRTTQPRHKAGVTELASRLVAAGDIYKGSTEGWYCVGCEAFKQEKDLVDGRCPLHPQTEPQWLKETTTSSASPGISSRSWTTSPPIRTSSNPTCVATRSCGSLRWGSTTSP